MDEPCSALDPISTSAIEDLIHELKTEYTIVIVTHNMQQAARVSEDTAFFNLAGAGQPGRLIEMNPTTKIFSNPDEGATEAYISGRFGGGSGLRVGADGRRPVRRALQPSGPLLRPLLRQIGHFCVISGRRPRLFYAHTRDAMGDRVVRALPRGGARAPA